MVIISNYKIFFLLSLLIFSSNNFSLESNFDKTENTLEFKSNPSEFIDKNIKEQYYFTGLARYYNQVKYYVISENSSINKIDDIAYNLTPEKRLAIVGRFNILLLQGINSKIIIEDSIIQFEDLSDPLLTADIFQKDELDISDSKLAELKYIHLFYPLAALSRFFEETLMFFHRYFNEWFWTIIIFSVCIKLLLLPLNILQLNMQNKMNSIHQKLAPQLINIKKNFDGEEAHLKIMAAYKQHGISPFYNLKVLFISMLQVPILISIFNTLGEMPQISNNSFLWIRDWSYPDTIGTFSPSIPLLGNSINFLPILMTLISIASNYLVTSTQQSNSLNIYVLAIAFFLLFYPFPAIMVWFWIAMNILQLVFQKISNNVKNS